MITCVASVENHNVFHSQDSLSKHYKDQLVYHNQLVTKTTKDVDLEKSIELKTVVMDQQLASIKSEVAQFQSEMATKMQPLIDAVVRTETTIQQLQEGFGEMALMVQTLQATSYSGTFIWRIPEVQRRRGEARSGRTVSLYSAPFYTSRHGYKIIKITLVIKIHIESSLQLHDM